MYEQAEKPKKNESKSVANDFSKKQNNSVSTFQFADRRPEAAAQRHIQELANKKIIQRMAVMAVDDLDLQTDSLVWNNLDYAVKQAPGEIGDLRTNKVWDQLNDNEEIRLVEHGEVKQIGPASASDIATSMFTLPNEIPANGKIGGITFQSCYAGVNGGSGSLVSDMVGELKTRGLTDIPVKGRTGVAFGFKGMGEETAETSKITNKKPYAWVNTQAEIEFQKHPAFGSSHANEKGFLAYFDAMYELRNEQTKTTNQGIFSAPFDYRAPWELLGITEANWDLLDPDVRAEQVADEMEDYWQLLSDSMQLKGGFKPQKKAIVTEVGKKAKKRGSGFCFLTTACTVAKGLPDDCKELKVLRAFRDGFMSKLEGGTALIKEYYDIAPQIVKNIQASYISNKEFISLYDEIVTCVALIERGKNNKALSIYKNMVLRLKSKWM